LGFSILFKDFCWSLQKNELQAFVVANSGNPKENQFVGRRILGDIVSERRRGVSFLCLMRMVGSLLYCCCGRRFVVVVVGLLMLWFLSCFGMKIGFANNWLELLLQVLR
jgi:hypothetical protein